MRQTDKIQLPPHIENLLATATHDRLIAQIRSLYHAWQTDVRDLERYGEAVYEATGETISGGLDPTDPGPDPVEFDLFQIRWMGERIKRLRAALEGLVRDIENSERVDATDISVRVAKLALHYNKDPEV